MTDPVTLYRREKRRAEKRMARQAAAVMAEAKRMWEAELAREAEARKGGRPAGPSLKGTGIVRFTVAGGRPATQPCGTNAAYRRGCRCGLCKGAKRAYEASRPKRDRSERRTAPHHKGKRAA